MQALRGKAFLPESFDITCFVVIANGARESILDSRTGDLVMTLEEEQKKLQTMEDNLLEVKILFLSIIF